MDRGERNSRDDDEVVTLADEAAKARLRGYHDHAEGGARQIYVDPSATIKRYVHSASELVRQGKECVIEGDKDRAYIMLLRFTIFYLERLPEHPGFKTAPEKKTLGKECMAALDQVDELKKELETKRAKRDSIRDALDAARSTGAATHDRLVAELCSAKVEVAELNERRDRARKKLGEEARTLVGL